MLTILTTTDYKLQIEKAIASVDRLAELVELKTDSKDISATNKILVVNSTIKAPLNWSDDAPPYVLLEVAFSEKNFLAHVFLKLGNHQKAFEYLKEDDNLYMDFLIATHLQFGYEISDGMLTYLQQHSLHNLAIVLHYGNLKPQIDFSKLQQYYVEAIAQSENDEIKLFSGKHYINLLLDANRYEEAKLLAISLRDRAISEEANNAINVHLATILMNELSIPYDIKKLDEIEKLQQASISFYEVRNLNAQAGLLLIDAAEIANFKEDFIASKELINKAIRYFKEENIPEFLGEAGFKKAVLLYTWSKNGSPQYYKAAINAFQDVLKVFKRGTHPKRFADVHHNLALIYSEIPVAPEERPMWAAFSASSFKEVLNFYKKEDYPYEYAMACHNYATALMDFPPAKLHDNLDKAAGFFEEALKIRTKEVYPFERALTLINQLELYWLTHNEDKTEETKKYSEMLSKAEEVKTLVTDENLLQRANDHLERLNKLKTLIN